MRNTSEFPANIPGRDSDRFRAFRQDLARLLKSRCDNVILTAVAELAWDSSFMVKDDRVQAIQQFIEEAGIREVRLGSTRYDTMELVIALSHYRRAAYPGIHSSNGSTGIDRSGH